MTKKLNRIISALLAFVMVFALGSFSAFADDDATDTNDTDETTSSGYTITIKDTNSGHTYKIYQIFTGDVANGILSNIEYGSGVTEDKTNANYVSASDAAKYIAKEYSSTDATSYYGEEIIKYLEDIGVTINKDNGITLTWDGTDGAENYSTSVSSTGYYLIIDETETLTGGDSYTSYIIEIVGDNKEITLSPKKSTVEVKKEVEEINDSTTDAGTYGDTADYDIDDAINFRLTGTLPSNYSEYKEYYYVFHDVECDGLDFDSESVVVKIDGTTVSTGYQVLVKGTDTMQDSNCTFEVVFEDLNKCYSAENTDTPITVTANSKIVVEYQSTLNSSAVIGSTGNDNTVKLEYSNDSNYTGEGRSTGETPEYTVTVFTFELLVNKVTPDTSEGAKDGDTTALAGAGFTLYKYDAEKDDYVAVGTEQTGVSSFVFTGLDAGQYKLEETTTPAGYNTAADIYFEVVAEYEQDTDDSYKVSSLTIKNGNTTLSDVGGSFTVTPDATGIDKVKTETDTNGITTVSGTTSISTDVVNNTGTGLPETGGIGTKIFYTLGGILVVGAIVLLITKRRMKRA